MEDYQNASERHLQDAELLFNQTPKRLANASYLFGLSAECSLKAIARKLEPAAKFGGKKGHIPDLFSELQNVSPRIGINPDLVRDIASLEPQFSNWTVSQRYASQTTFTLQTLLYEQAGSKQAHLLMTNCLQGLR